MSERKKEVYSEKSKERTLNYRKNKQHPVSISYTNEEFENRIAPAIKKSGLPVATFFKTAVDEKIHRDGLDL